MHVEQVLGDVPREQRCRCREAARAQETRDPESAPRAGVPWWKLW
jgi:hypothetical protein